MPVGKILTASLKQFGGILGAIFTKYWYVLLLPAIAAYFMVIAYKSGFGTDQGGGKSYLIAILLNAVFWIAQTPISISWIEKVVKKTPAGLSFDARVWPSWGYQILLILILICPIGLIFFICVTLGKEGGMNQYMAGSIALVLSAVWWGLVQRFCLVLPAIALRNSNTRISRSWSLTRGHNIKIVLIMLPVLLLLIVTSTLAQAFSQAMMFDQVSAVIGSSIVGVITMASTMLWAEIQGRLFVFFLAPQKIGEYI